MKQKQRTKPLKRTRFPQVIPAVYDISSEMIVCKKRGLKAQEAIAWMEGGRVKISLNEDFLKKRDTRKTQHEIYQKWLDETGLEFGPIFGEQSQPDAAKTARYARCVAASSGEIWSAWKEMDVCRFLLTPEGASNEKCIYMIPIEYTIFDPAKSPGVWFDAQDEDILTRCFECGISMLNETAQVYCQAVELIDNFEETFEALHPDLPRTQATRPAELLRDCKKASIDLIVAVTIKKFQGPKKSFINAGTALRQGFLVGRWLARAEAIIGNVKDMKLALQKGFSGQHPSDFWKWLVALQETTLKGKTASELFTWLDGQPDPDYKGFKLQIVDDNKLMRGNGDSITLSSFQSSLSRAKKRLQEETLK